MDQREWDYGARLPRERSAAEPWSTREGPESTDSPQVAEPGAPVWGTGSVTDTGSMQPIPEAVAWSLRAEAWAQNEDQAVERSGSGTVSRWSDVAATGRPPIPADGVGWRTSTAEWRSTDSARWRQTTEWRSASGTHGWRTTTEAWQTGGDATGFVPPVDPPTRLPAISGTAWPTPENGDPSATTPPTSAVPSWQQPPTTSVPGWQQPDDTPSWQRERPATEATPSWQQRPADAAPSWQQRPADAAPSWQQPPADATPSWQQRPADAAPSWERPADPAPSWQRRPDDPTPSWQQRPADAAPSWQRADDRPSWQQFAGPPATPAVPPAPSWQPADAPRPDRPSWDSRPSWQQFAETTRPSRGNGADRETPADRPGESSPSWRNPQPPTAYTGSRSAPGTFDDGRHLVREDDRAQWRRETGFDDGSRQAGRRRATEPGSRTSGGTGWTVRSDADNWAGHTDTGSIPAFQDPVADSPGWRRDAGEQPDSWRTSSTTNSWQSSAPTTGSRRGTDPADRWRSGDETSGSGRTDSWRSGDEAGTGWRSQEPTRDSWRSAEPPADGWRSGDQTRDGRRDTGSWRRDPDPGPPVDPWAQSAGETGVIPLPLQPRDREGGGWQSRTDTGSWQRDLAGRPDDGGRRSRADRADTGSGRREIESGARSESGSWQRDQDGPDTGTWQRGGRRSSWQSDDEASADARPDTDSRRRGDEPRSRTDTGSWQREDEPRSRTDTGSWQREDEPRSRTDTGSWQRED
ncbi:hypothetical protein AB0K03_18600, partial [Actinoplanes sp. NPDC049316]